MCSDHNNTINNLGETLSLFDSALVMTNAKRLFYQRVGQMRDMAKCAPPPTPIQRWSIPPKYDLNDL